MQTIQFKTNIHCANCVAKVTPVLNKREGIVSWNIDTENPDKILTIETETLSAADIEKVIKRTGFETVQI